MKDSVPFTEKHDVIYRSVCATKNCNENYVRKCARRLQERVKVQNGCFHLLHLVKQARDIGHLPVTGQ